MLFSAQSLLLCCQSHSASYKYDSSCDSLATSVCSSFKSISAQQSCSPQFLHIMLQGMNFCILGNAPHLQIVYVCEHFLKCASPRLSCTSLQFSSFPHVAYNNLKCFCSPYNEIGDGRCVFLPVLQKMWSVVCSSLLLVLRWLLGGKVRDNDLCHFLSRSSHFLPESSYTACLITSSLKNAQEEQTVSARSFGLCLFCFVQTNIHLLSNTYI